MYGSLVTRVTTICVGVDRGSYVEVAEVGPPRPKNHQKSPKTAPEQV